MPPQRSSLSIGHKSGRWVVIGPLTLREVSGRKYPISYQLCRCSCGVERDVQAHAIKGGHSLSCGCDREEKRLASVTHHGGCVGRKPTRLYRVWGDMIGRCTRKSHPRFDTWGGRGIKVCVEWQDFGAFEKWAVESGYRDDLEIDRFPNNDGDYEPSNCRWATNKSQAENRRTTRHVVAYSETKSVFDWSKDARCVVSYTALLERIKAGWTPEDALTVLPQARNPRNSRR